MTPAPGELSPWWEGDVDGVTVRAAIAEALLDRSQRSPDLVVQLVELSALRRELHDDFA